MALIRHHGFDEGSSVFPAWISGAILTRVAGRTGNCAHLGANATLQWVTPAVLATYITGFAIRTAALTTNNQIAFMEGSVTHITLRQNASGGIDVIRGVAGGTVIGSTPNGVLTAAAFGYLEAKIIVSDTVGAVTLKLNEATVLTLTGVDTRNAGTGAGIDTVQITTATAGSTDVDDLYVCDATGAANNDFLGDCQVLTRLPSGNGSSTQWLGSDGNSVDNYALVNETSPSSAEYVGSSTSGQRDLLAVTDLPATPTYTVLAYKETVYAAKSDAGTPPSFRLVQKGNAGAIRTEAMAGLSTVYALLDGAEQITDPDGSALTTAKINAMEIGYDIP